MTVSSSLGFILSPLHNFVEEMNNFPVFVVTCSLLCDILAWWTISINDRPFLKMKCFSASNSNKVFIYGNRLLPGHGGVRKTYVDGPSQAKTTSFPGPLSFSSLVVEERDPGCGWSRVC